jgi:hypothetical protein
MKKLCVYLHFRQDDGLCFYVGMGVPTRPFDFNNRSVYWKRVRDKHGVRVEIIAANLSFEDAAHLERSSIAQLVNSPIAKLVNLTSGGEGMTGVKNSDQTRKRKSESAIKLNADPVFREKKLKQLAETRNTAGNAKRSASHKLRLSDPIVMNQHMDTFSKNRACVQKALLFAQTEAAKIKRGASVHRYLTAP